MDTCDVNRDGSCGCSGGERPVTPFFRKAAITNQVLMAAPVAVGTAALWRFRRRKLLLYLPAAAAFFTVWRRYVCARCQYYGTECSTMLGVLTEKMMPKDETKSLDRNMMVVDFIYMGALMMIPMRQVFRRPLTALAYFGLTAAGFGSIFLNSCSRCGNEFCPMKDLSRMLNDQQ
jgi:hypothetical protein